MEGHPLDLVVEHQAADHERLAKVQGVNTPGGVVLEGDARREQEVDGVLRENVVVEVEPEVELPAGTAGGVPVVLVRKRQAQLDDLEQVDVALEGIVVEAGGLSRSTLHLRDL